MQEPGEGDLRDGCSVGLRYCVEFSAGTSELASGDGEPGDERDFVFGAVLDDILVLAVADVVLVLDADDFDDLASPVDLVGLDLAEAYVPNFALLLELLDGSEGLFAGDLGVDAVQLPEIDAFELEAAEAHLYLLD